jgi:hypothetical protein
MAIQMFLPTAISIAAEYFPLLATRLGGKRGGAIAEEVVQIAASVAGTPPDASAREIIAGLSKDPTRVEQVRVRLAELDVESHEAELRDRESARQYQASVGAGGRMRGNIMLGGVVIGLVACVIAVFVSRGTNETRLDPGVLALLTTIAGALLKMLSDAFAFEFGSSAGSKEKDQQIAQFQRDLSGLQQATIERTPRAAASPAAAARPVAPPAASGPTFTEGTVVAVGDADVIDASNDPNSGATRLSRRRDFVTELREMAGLA